MRLDRQGTPVKFLQMLTLRNCHRNFAESGFHDALIGLRVDAESETEGLDVSQHDERGYILN